MAALTDHIDRLGVNARKLKSSAISVSSHPRSDIFTHAVLNAQLGDLIRDVDPSELGLFTLVSPTTTNATPNPPGPQLARTEFATATPLRKQPYRSEAPTKKAQPEIEPEVYAKAALRYIDKYQGIRPMPRAASQVKSILDQVVILRTHINELNKKLEHAKVSRENLGGVIAEEEGSIDALHQQIANLKKRKEAAQDAKNASKTTRFSRTRIANMREKPKPPASPIRPAMRGSEEESFWQLPTPSSTAMNLAGGLLKEEHVDLADMSTSFATPLPSRRTSSKPKIRLGQLKFPPPSSNTPPRSPSSPERPSSSTPTASPSDPTPQRAAPLPRPDTLSLSPNDTEENEDETTSPDATILADTPTKPPAAPALDPSQIALINTPGRTHKAKVRVTHEVERIVTRMWATMGQVIMPGNTFDCSGSGGERPPNAKATISHLEKLSASDPAVTSPSASSVSSTNPSQNTPTSQQIITSHLLLCLLSSNSSPPFSMPLNSLKDAVAAKAGGTDKTQVATRTIYNCVAKRLLKIDRSTREQTVRFDA